MIRLSGLVELRPIHSLKPEITETFDDETPNEPAPEAESPVDDHEGRMAKSDLFSLHKQASELYNMMGENDQLEGWMQSKITQAADYINAVYNAMQYEKSNAKAIGAGDGTPADPDQPPETVRESAPAGWEKTVKSMKKHKEIDNPFALAHYMKKMGYKSHK